MKKILSVILISIFLTSCASGSYILTGEKRTPIKPELVKLYVSPPQKYDIIGIVNASSDSGWTSQGDMDYAVSELKSQAARLGANGIIITGRGEVSSAVVGTYSNGMMYSIPTSAQSVSGQAVYVIQE